MGAYRICTRFKKVVDNETNNIRIIKLNFFFNQTALTDNLKELFFTFL